MKIIFIGWTIYNLFICLACLTYAHVLVYINFIFILILQYCIKLKLFSIIFTLITSTALHILTLYILLLFRLSLFLTWTWFSRWFFNHWSFNWYLFCWTIFIIFWIFIWLGLFFGWIILLWNDLFPHIFQLFHYLLSSFIKFGVFLIFLFIFKRKNNFIATWLLWVIKYFILLFISYLLSVNNVLFSFLTFKYVPFPSLYSFFSKLFGFVKKFFFMFHIDSHEFKSIFDKAFFN